MLDGYDDAALATAAALRAEWRADHAEWTRAALEVWEHERTLVDVARSCLHRGDTVALEFPGRTFTGVLTAVGDDVARLAIADGSVDAHLTSSNPGLVLRVLQPARAGGDRGDPTVVTFRARLLQLEGTMVELAVGGREATLRGTLGVGRDQLSVVDRDGVRAYVPTGSVTWVRPVDVD